MSAPVPTIDRAAVRHHLGIFARLAGDVPCRLVLGGFGQNIDTGEKLPAIAESFAPADADVMVDRVAAIDAEPHRNIYLSTAIFRPDLEKGRKGSEEDILGVLAIVQDFDAKDMGDAAREWAVRCPDGASMVLQTSGIPKPSFQVFYIFKRPVPLERAKAIAAALDRKTGADSCSKDMSHVWRIMGTNNKPKVSKIAEGRPREPQPVQISVPFHESRLWDVDDLERAVSALPDLAPDKPKPKPADISVDRAKVRPVTADDLRHMGLEEKWIDKAGRVYADPKIRDEYPSRSEHQFGVTRAMVRAGIAPEVIYSIITDKAWGVSESVREKGHAYAERQVRRAFEKEEKQHKGAGASGGATSLAQDVLTSLGRPIVHHNRGFYDFDGSVYRPLEEATVRAAVWSTLDKNGAEPCSRMVSDVMDAFKALAHLPSRDHNPPCWINGAEGADPAAMIPARNGLVDPSTGEVTPHGADLFNFNILPFDYNPNAPEPALWLAKLRQWWPDDDETECIDLLQEWFGYLLTPDTSQQKILSVFGGPRCGKGTIVRVLTAMLGKSNVCNPKIAALGERFGREGLIGKTAAIITDMRIGKDASVPSIVETLLTVSGEDGQSVQRKNTTDWEGLLRTRIVMFSNDVFSLHDPSGALSSRLIVLPMHGCWLGKEDTDLTAKLLAELPGILNWAIEGYRRLAKNKRFTALKSEDAAAIADIAADFGSVPGAFIAENCVYQAGVRVTKDALVDAYREWMVGRGLEPSGRDFMLKNLLSAMMGRGVRTSQPWMEVGGKKKRVHVFTGIRLLTDEERTPSGMHDYGVFK